MQDVGKGMFTYSIHFSSNHLFNHFYLKQNFFQHLLPNIVPDPDQSSSYGDLDLDPDQSSSDGDVRGTEHLDPVSRLPGHSLSSVIPGHSSSSSSAIREEHNAGSRDRPGTAPSTAEEPHFTTFLC